MKKILVTGASGFIGNYVITDLLRSGFQVVATSSTLANIEDKPWKAQVEYIPFNFKDLSHTTDYYSFFQQPDLLIHLAWQGLPNYKALFHFEENLSGQYFFLKNMITNGLKDLTVTGTCFEYGFVEGCLNESLVTNPSNAYAIAKDTLRKFLEQLQNDIPFSLKWIRLFYMFGKGQSAKSLFSQLDKAVEHGEATFNMSGGEQVRDYLPVEQVAEYIRAIATQQAVTGIVNCCSGQPIKVKEIVQEYLRNKKATISLNFGYYPYPDYEPMEFWGDNKKLKTILNNERSDRAI